MARLRYFEMQRSRPGLHEELYLLHSSAANESDRHRRSFIMCYSAWSNPQRTKDGFIRREPCPVGADGELV